MVCKVDEQWGLISKPWLPGCLQIATEKNIEHNSILCCLLFLIINFLSSSHGMRSFPTLLLNILAHIFPTHHIHSIHQIYSHLWLFCLLSLKRERRKDEEKFLLYQAPSRLLPSLVSCERGTECSRELVQKYYYLFILWIHPQKFHYTYFMMVAPSYKPVWDIKIYLASAFHFSPIIISYLLLLLSFVLIRLNIISYVR